MNSRGYIGLGIVCAVIALAVLMGAQSNDEVMDSLAQSQAAMSGMPEPDSGSDGGTIAAIALFAAAGVLILIGSIGAGVKVGKRED